MIRFEIVGQINDVGGSLVTLGEISGESFEAIKEQALEIACSADTTPELTDAFVCGISNDKNEPYIYERLF